MCRRTEIDVLALETNIWHLMPWRAEKAEAVRGELSVFEQNLMEAVIRPGGVILCRCGLTLNGVDQYKDHLIGKKHKKEMRRLLEFAA